MMQAFQHNHERMESVENQTSEMVILIVNTQLTKKKKTAIVNMRTEDEVKFKKMERIARLEDPDNRTNSKKNEHRRIFSCSETENTCSLAVHRQRRER